jgi:TRAP-type C4-dicarboxylate transport system substrate-binding protein
MSQKSWNALGAKQGAFQAAVDKAVAWSTAEHLKRESELAASFKQQGLDVYVPDVAAFRANAQKVYLASDEAKAWPAGFLDKVGAIK